MDIFLTQLTYRRVSREAQVRGLDLRSRAKFAGTELGNRRQISRPSHFLRATRTAFSVERSRISAVGGRDPKVGSGVGKRQRGSGGGTGGYCLLGDLSSNTSRQAASPGHGQRGEPVGF